MTAPSQWAAEKVRPSAERHFPLFAAQCITQERKLKRNFVENNPIYTLVHRSFDWCNFSIDFVLKSSKFLLESQSNPSTLQLQHQVHIFARNKPFNRIRAHLSRQLTMITSHITLIYHDSVCCVFLATNETPAYAILSRLMSLSVQGNAAISYPFNLNESIGFSYLMQLEFFLVFNTSKAHSNINFRGRSMKLDFFYNNEM